VVFRQTVSAVLLRRVHSDVIEPNYKLNSPIGQFNSVQLCRSERALTNGSCFVCLTVRVLMLGE